MRFFLLFFCVCVCVCVCLPFANIFWTCVRLRRRRLRRKRSDDDDSDLVAPTKCALTPPPQLPPQPLPMRPMLRALVLLLLLRVGLRRCVRCARWLAGCTWSLRVSSFAVAQSSSPAVAAVVARRRRTTCALCLGSAPRFVYGYVCMFVCKRFRPASLKRAMLVRFDWWYEL